MSKRETLEPAADSWPAKPASRSWGRSARIAASVFLGVHLLAVIAGPISLPPSILGDQLRTVLQPYLDATYLDHAYKFFAPDPGPSHLVRYELEMPDGSRREGLFPDRHEHWPRLLYHRHFMLSEFVAMFPPDADPQAEWHELKLSSRQAVYAESYARHLLARHGARRVSLYLVEHGIPGPEEVLEGLRLDDPSLYRERLLGRYE